MLQVWTEFYGYFASPAVYWQLVVAIISLLAAWLTNRLFYDLILQNAGRTWKGRDGIKRVLFPLTAYGLVCLGTLILRQWQDTGLLTLVGTLLSAIVIIRLAVTTLRYIFLPSAWLKATEGAIVGFIWLLVTLHLLGLLPELINALETINVAFGKHSISLMMILQIIAIILFTMVAVLSLSSFIENKLMQVEQIDMNLRVVMTKLVRVLLIFIGVLVTLSAVGFDITLLSVFGGALGVGLGFGLQKIASNYISGFIILLDQSIHIDDVVTIAGEYGVVKQIRARYMVLRKLDGTEVLIPNEVLISESVINHSFTERTVRVCFPVQIGYESSLDKAMELMRNAASEHRRVLKEPPPEVQVTGFGDNGIDLRMIVWISDPEEGFASLKSSLYVEIWRLFQHYAISVPYPQRDVRILSDENK